MSAVPEFSRSLNADRINVGTPRTETLTANAAERAALAKRFNMPTLDELKAVMTATRVPHQPAVISIEGRVTGRGTQSCVVTLEPVPAVVDETFETLLASADYVQRYVAEHGEEDLDAPEVIENGYIDWGEIAAQYFSLALEPYPRKEGLEEPAVAPEVKEGHYNPFAVLSVLKDKK